MKSIITAVFVLLGGSVHAQEGAPLWESLSYVYDGAGNIIAIGQDVYRYDGAGRLEQAHTGGGAERQEFTYDVHGNLKSIKTVPASGTAFVSAHAVNAATNQLNGACGTSADICFEGRYDAAGNQTRRDQNTTLPDQYSWDALNMMRELQTERKERYVYDANDERIAVIERPTGSDARRRYTIRGADNKVLRELVHDVATNTWTLEKDYVYRGATLLASYTGAAATPARHYHPDHLGSTRLITDKDGFALARHTYWPFGRETDSSDDDTERLKFTGHERDSLPGSPGFDLDYMHARYYDPSVGRFLTLDPTGRSANRRRPQTWNRYAYAYNDPVNRVDPDGRCPDREACKIDQGRRGNAVRAEASWSRFLGVVRTIFAVKLEAKGQAGNPAVNARASVSSTASVQRNGTVVSTNETNGAVNVAEQPVVSGRAHANYTTPPGEPTQVDNDYGMDGLNEANFNNETINGEEKVPIMRSTGGWDIGFYRTPGAFGESIRTGTQVLIDGLLLLHDKVYIDRILDLTQ